MTISKNMFDSRWYRKEDSHEHTPNSVTEKNSSFLKTLSSEELIEFCKEYLVMHQHISYMSALRKKFVSCGYSQSENVGLLKELYRQLQSS
jgi:hypothetical protein